MSLYVFLPVRQCQNKTLEVVARTCGSSLWVLAGEKEVCGMTCQALQCLPNNVTLRGEEPTFDPISQHLALRRS